MANFLFTLAEDSAQTTPIHFAVKFSVDENDCYDFSNGLQELGHSVYFVNWSDLDLKAGAFNRMFLDNEKRFVEPLPLEQIDVAFVYKMEGFLFEQEKFFAMLRLFEAKCRRVVNHPLTITHNIDKAYMFALERKGIAVAKSSLADEGARKLLEEGQKLVLKPLRAERGYGALLATSVEDFDHLGSERANYLAQEYLPEIRDGERSLAYLGFQFQHAVLKKPSAENPDEFRCNESLGGTVEVYDPTEEELSYADSVLRAYESFGLEVHFSRVDFVNGERGPILIEVELLNPSIYANYSKRGSEFGRAFAAYFDGLLPTENQTTTQH